MNEKIKELIKQREHVEKSNWSKVCAIQKKIDKEFELLMHNDNIDIPQELFAIVIENNNLSNASLVKYTLARVKHYAPEIGFAQLHYIGGHSSGPRWFDIDNIKDKHCIDDVLEERGLYLTANEAIASISSVIKKLGSNS